MQAFARGSLQRSFFDRKMETFLASFLVNPLLASCERLRSATPSLRLSEKGKAQYFLMSSKKQKPWIKQRLSQLAICCHLKPKHTENEPSGGKKIDTKIDTKASSHKQSNSDTGRQKSTSLRFKAQLLKN